MVDAKGMLNGDFQICNPHTSSCQSVGGGGGGGGGGKYDIKYYFEVRYHGKLQQFAVYDEESRKGISAVLNGAVLNEQF